METIKVNMTPCDEVQTIHASQNDGEAREWGFALHNNGDAIDSSSISDQLVFKSYKGGTEQILPENGAVPVTAPFVGDIKYPDATRTDQEFLYRQSPAEEDGLAWINSIKGNTLVWNQQSQSNRDTYTPYGLTGSCTDGLWSFQGTYTGENGSAFRCGKSYVSIPAGHKVLLLNTSPWKVRLQGNEISTTANTPQNRIIETVSGALADIVVHAYGLTSGDTVNVQCHFGIIDLTVMFGETKANEIYAMEQAQSGSGVAYFKSLFPLDFYPYDSGSLIPFNGNGIKTVGKNLMPTQNLTKVGDNYRIGDSASYYHLPQGTYTFSSKGKMAYAYYQAENDSVNNIIHNNTTLVGTFTLAEGDYRFWFYSPNSTADEFYDIQLEFGSTATAYEPYTESVINLPISTYFPSGMNSVPKAYDELVPSKATQRVGRSLMQNIAWSMISSGVFGANLSNVPPSWTRGGTGVLLSPLYTEESWYTIDLGTYTDKSIHGLVYNNVLVLRVYDSSCTTLEQFTTKITDVPLLYELATPIETSFTTASLVTENTEIPLFNEDGVLIGKCTEQLSENPGFIDAKIKLSDSDGTCYSNKLQLHVERSPQ